MKKFIGYSLIIVPTVLVLILLLHVVGAVTVIDSVFISLGVSMFIFSVYYLVSKNILK